jgi:hypothetical protein
MKELIRNAVYMIKYDEQSQTLVFTDFEYDLTITVKKVVTPSLSQFIR